MRSSIIVSFVLLTVQGVAITAIVRGQTPPSSPPNPYPYTPDEPVSKQVSFAKSAEYLDGVARFWMRENSCGACHANFAYVLARPALSEHPNPVLAEARRYLEQRKPEKRFSFDAHAVAIAFALAWDDAHTGGKLRPTTRTALQRMWALQRPTGNWRQLGCGEIIPSENDRHYTAALAALAAGIAPEGYAHSAEAQDGLTKLRRYFAKTPAYSLHNDAMVLWASAHLDGLMTAAERDKTVKDILARQRADGGWSFPTLTLHTIPKNQPDHPSDGYGTGFAVYILRQAGLSASQPEMRRGVAWLQTHQKVSGRWFTPAGVHPTEGGVGSRDLYAQNHATAFSVLALKACQVTERPHRPAVAAIVELADHLQSPDVSLRAKRIVDTHDSCDISQVFGLKVRGGAGIGTAIQAGHKDSIHALVNDWCNKRPPTRLELQAHQADLVNMARVLQAMAELAPHRGNLFFPKQDDARAEQWRSVSDEFRSSTRSFRAAIETRDPQEVRKTAGRLMESCNACHKIVGI